jgi:Type I phosphodiesterase / nucleotide pyrophosphatase
MRSRMAVVVLLVAVSCTASGEMDGDPPSRAPDGFRPVAWACRLPPDQLLRIREGYRPGRSGEVQFVPRQPSYFGEHSHSGPWAYLQRVPLLFVGPPHVPEGVTARRPVRLADVAPTLVRSLRFDFGDVDGRPLPEAIGRAAEPPAIVVTVVLDAAGMNVLREHPTAWPTLRTLRRRGTWFARATVGSSPSVSPAIHGTLGTGLPPAEHGLVDMVFREGGEVVEVRDDPRHLLAPTLADRFDAAHRNRPIVALLGHPLMLGLMGEGSAFPGGDRDPALVESVNGWRPPAGPGVFRFPRYASATAGLDAALRRLDRLDGQPNGAWRGQPLAGLSPTTTPAFAEFHTRTAARVIRREGMGEDRVPDLLFLNYNQINEVGHHWSMNSPQMADTVRSTDDALRDLIGVLDRRVGRGRWMLVVTADHGSTPDRSVSGAFVIDQAELTRDLRDAFDHDRDSRSAIAQVRVTQLWLDRAELAEGGFRPLDVAWFLTRYTRADNRTTPNALMPATRDEPVFTSAFPGAVLRESCREAPGDGER